MIEEQAIFICKMKLPNDPNKKTQARQYLVIESNHMYIAFLTTSSIIGKEQRVYGSKGKINGINVNAIIDGDLYIENGFNTPTFIDCRKRYEINKSEKINFGNLFSRNVTQDLWQKVNNKFEEFKQNNIEQSIYKIIDIEEILLLNPKLKVS